MSERYRPAVLRLLALAMAASFVITAVPQGVLASGGQIAAPAAPAQVKIYPKFWVEPDTPYVPPPITAPRDGREVNGYAVLLGINAYPGSPLQGCISDITAIRDKLTNTYGWSLANIHFVTDADVTPARMTQEIQWLASKVDMSSTAVFSFSGHGSAGEILAYPMNAVSDDTISAELCKLVSSENICIIDACFSGADFALNITSPKYISMMACGANEYAADGDTFSKAWVEGLGTTTNGEVEDAFAYAYNKIQAAQHPVMWDNYPGKLMLGKKPPAILPSVPDLSGPEDTNVTATFSLYETDPVDGHDLLQWSVEWYDVRAIKSISGMFSTDDRLTFTPVKDWTGKTNITLVLNNSAGRTCRQSVNITFTPVNDLPSVIRLDKSWSPVERTKPVKVIVYGQDPDNLPNTLDLQLDYRPAGGAWTTDSATALYVTNRWEVGFVPPPGCSLGTADFRARLRDAEGFGEFTNAMAFLEIKNALPSVDWINSSALEIHRTQNVTFYSQGSDPEDNPGKVTCEIAVRAQKDTVWTALANVTLSQGRWSAVFCPAPSAGLGFYDVRARLHDADGDFGQWKELDAMVLVKNALPVTQGLEFSESKVNRGNTVTVSVQGKDIEDTQSSLICDIHYQPPGGTWAKLEGVTLSGNRWEAPFSPAYYAKVGNYSFRAILKDSSGQLSDWLYRNASLCVINSIPEVECLTFSRMTVIRTQNITLRVEGSDFEDRNTNLTARVQYQAPGAQAWSDTYLTGGKYDGGQNVWSWLFCPPSTAATGVYDFRASLFDRDGDWGNWYGAVQTVAVANNVPVAICAAVPDVVYEKAPVSFDAGSSTDVEGDVEARWIFGDGATEEGARVSHTYTAGGQKTVTLTVIDGDGAKATLTSTLRVNLLPTAKATFRQSDGVNNFNVRFDGSPSTDPEGAVFAYIWDFDISNDSNGDGIADNDWDSSSPSPGFNYAKEGRYTARLTVRDQDNGSATMLLEVHVRAVSAQNGTVMFLLLGLVIAGAAFAGGIAASRSRKKSPPSGRGERVIEPRSEAPPPSSQAGPVSPPPRGYDVSPAYGALEAYPAYYASQPPAREQYYEPLAEPAAAGLSPPPEQAIDAEKSAPSEAPSYSLPEAERNTADPDPGKTSGKPGDGKEEFSDILKRLEHITGKY